MTGFVLIHVRNSKTAKETLLRTFRSQHLQGKLKFTMVVKNTKFQATLHNNEKIFCEPILKSIDCGDMIFLKHSSFESDSDDVFFEIGHVKAGEILPSKESIKNLSQEKQNIIMFPISEPKIYFSFIQMFDFSYMGNEVWTTGDPFSLLKNTDYKTITNKVGEINLLEKNMVYYNDV